MDFKTVIVEKFRLDIKKNFVPGYKDGRGLEGIVRLSLFFALATSISLLLIFGDILYPFSTHPIAIYGLFGLILIVYSALILHPNWEGVWVRGRMLANREVIQLIRSFMLCIISFATILLLYIRTSYLMMMGGEDLLWLLYVLIGFEASRQRRFLYAIAPAFFSCFLLFISETIRLNLMASVFWEGLYFFKSAWIIGGTVLCYFLYRIFYHYLPAFFVIQVLNNRWFSNTNMQEIANVIVSEIVKQFHVEVVNIFIKKSFGFQLIACSDFSKQDLIFNCYTLGFDNFPLTVKSYTTGSILTDKDFNRNFYKDNQYPLFIFPKTRSALVLPLFTGEQEMGVLEILSYQSGTFHNEDRKIMATLAANISRVLKIALDSENLKIQREFVESLRNVVEYFSNLPFSVLQITEMLKEICEQGRAWSKADLVILYELDYSQGNMVLLSGPYTSGIVKSKEIIIPNNSDSMVNLLARMNQALFIDEINNYNFESLGINYCLIDLLQKNFSGEVPNFTSLVSVSLRGKEDDTKGYELYFEKDSQLISGLMIFLFVTRQELELFKERQELFLAFSGLASLAIQRIRMFEKETRLESERHWRTTHDMILTHLSSIKARAEELVEEYQPIPEIQNVFNSISISLNDLSGIVRLEALSLDPTLEGPLIRRLKALKQRLQRDLPNLEFYLSLPPEDEFEVLPVERQIHLYAIAQEAITNAIKHGRAKKIWLDLTLENSTIEMTVEDNGTGFTPREIHRTSGLENMRQRAKLMGTDLHIDAAVGRTGVIVSIVLPMK